MAKINMLRGLSTSFATITKDADTLYFLTDTGEIYLGSKKMSLTDLSNYVEKIEGKGLSANDFTDELKQAVESLKSAAFTDASDYATAKHDHDASEIITGVLALDRIPEIPSEKITSLDAAKLTGTLSYDRLAGEIPSRLLPSYVDDVLEFASRNEFPATGEDHKIYVTKDTNLTYRWSGTDYVEISKSLALGETDSTAFPGDRGVALEGAVSAHVADTANPHGVTKAQVGLGKVEDKTSAEIRAELTSADIEGALGYVPPATDTLYSAGAGLTLTEGNQFVNTGVRSIATGVNGHITVDTNGTANDVQVYVHPTTPGNLHVPAGGAVGQVLVFSADGAAAWGQYQPEWGSF